MPDAMDRKPGESLNPVYQDYLFCFNRFGGVADINIILLSKVVLPPTFQI